MRGVGQNLLARVVCEIGWGDGGVAMVVRLEEHTRANEARVGASDAFCRDGSTLSEDPHFTPELYLEYFLDSCFWIPVLCSFGSFGSLWLSLAFTFSL